MYDPIRPVCRESGEDLAAFPPAARVSLGVQLASLLFTARRDKALASGCVVAVGSATYLYAQRITAIRHRESIARAFRRCVGQARDPAPGVTSRLDVHRDNILAAEDLIDRVTLWLHSPRPVTACGMARLRRLLADGAGPMYQHGRGDLHDRLLAALTSL